MARLLTAGAEGKLGFVEDISNFGGAGTTRDTTVARSGSASYKLTGNSELSCNPALAAGGTYYARAYQRVTGYPATGPASMLHVDNTPWLGAFIDTNGDLGLGWWNAGVQTWLGAGRVNIPTSTWVRIELKVTRDSTNWTSAELRVNGAVVQTWSGTIAINFARVEIGDATGQQLQQWVDDIAINDATGSSQNSWPGAGAVVLLLPTADAAVGNGWTKPGGATTGLWSSVDDPTGTGGAYSTSSADAEKQIENIASDASTNYDATLQTYLAAGLASNATVRVVQPVALTGSDNATDTAGAIEGVSNPAITSASFAAFDNGVAGASLTNWRRVLGNVVYDPAVTLGSAPVLRIGKRTAITRAAMACLMGLLVEYVYARTGTAVVTGGGSTSSSGAKGAKGTGAVVGGGIGTSAGRKAAGGISTVAGGGNTASAGTKAATGTNTVTGGGSGSTTGFASRLRLIDLPATVRVERHVTTVAPAVRTTTVKLEGRVTLATPDTRRTTVVPDG